LAKDELRDLEANQTLFRWVKSVPFEELESCIRDVAGMTGIEGVVIELRDGKRVKMKTDAYSNLHRLQGRFLSPSQTFKAVLMETSDDLKGKVAYDPLTPSMIEKIEAMVKPKITKILKRRSKTFTMPTRISLAGTTPRNAKKGSRTSPCTMLSCRHTAARMLITRAG
jgi:hypothetical protein